MYIILLVNKSIKLVVITVQDHDVEMQAGDADEPRPADPPATGD